MGTHRLIRISDHSYEVVLDEPPPNCVALKMAPRSMEQLLGTGVWLVLLIAVWSVPDIEHIDRAVRLATQYPQLMVGIRPFDSSEEAMAWLPDAPVSTQSPFWIVLEGGRIRHTLVGVVSDEQIAEAVEGNA